MRIVLDCNVIISASLNSSVCRMVVSDVLKNHILCASEEIFMEYEEVISRKKFKHVSGYLYSLMEEIYEVAECVTITKSDFSLPDKKDIIYLDTALSSGAQCIITGNKKDFPEPRYKGTTIIAPVDFLDISFLEEQLQS